MGGGGGLGGIVDPIFGGDQTSGSANAAAMAGQAANKQRMSEVMPAIHNAQKQVGDATVAGLLAFDKDIARQEKNLARQEQLISQLDPTIIEASQQALRLLRGEQSSTLGPLKAQRDRQRQKLLNTLREQLGPGAETSTAGIQALTRFDAETDTLFAGAQQDMLKTLGGVGAQFTSQRPDMLREIMGLSSFGQGKTDLGYKQGAFGLQVADAINRAYDPHVQTAGAEFTGDVIRGQQNRATGMKIFEGLLQAGTSYISKKPPTDGTT